MPCAGDDALGAEAVLEIDLRARGILGIVLDLDRRIVRDRLAIEVVRDALDQLDETLRSGIDDIGAGQRIELLARAFQRHSQASERFAKHGGEVHVAQSDRASIASSVAKSASTVISVPSRGSLSASRA